MSNHKHNYSQYSNKNKQYSNNQNQQHKPKPVVEDVKIPEITPEIAAMGHADPVGAPGHMGEPGIPKIKPVVETVETVTLPETVEGMVVNCAKLNVRAKPTVDSGIVCVLTVQSEIQIDVAKTTKDWVYVYTATGLEGYCMRQYIEAHM